MFHSARVYLPVCKNVLLILLLGIPNISSADICSYIDEAGKTHFVDSIDRVPAKYQEQARNRPPPREITKMDPAGVTYKDVPPASPAQSRNRKQVDIYVTSWCPYCKKLENFLNQNSIRFKKHDIEKNTQAQKTYEKLGAGGIPITTVGGEVLRGFDEGRLKQALGIR